MADVPGTDLLLKLLAGQERIEKRLDSMDARMERIEKRINDTNGSVALIARVVNELATTVGERFEDHERRIATIEDHPR